MTAISSDYSVPVTVNGFTCRNCTDVAYAKRHIDPEHPKSGPFGVNAESDPSRINEAVKLGGGLADPDRDGDLDPSKTVEASNKTLGTRVDLRV